MRRPWCFDPCSQHLKTVFCQFKLNGSLGLALDNRNPFANALILDKIVYREFDQIAATQLAVDRDIEQSQVP